MLDEIEKAVTVIGYGLELFHSDKMKRNINLSPKLSCARNSTEPRWKEGDLFFQLVIIPIISYLPPFILTGFSHVCSNRYLRNVSIKQTKYQNKPTIEFNPDGTLKFVELDIVNLNHMGNWEKVNYISLKMYMNCNNNVSLQIGMWTENGLDIKDITWPENSPVPPAGVPEKFSLKVTFLDEPSFVSMNDPDNETGECKTSRAVRCRFAPEHQLIG